MKIVALAPWIAVLLIAPSPQPLRAMYCDGLPFVGEVDGSKSVFLGTVVAVSSCPETERSIRPPRWIHRVWFRARQAWKGRPKRDTWVRVEGQQLDVGKTYLLFTKQTQGVPYCGCDTWISDCALIPEEGQAGASIALLNADPGPNAGTQRAREEAITSRFLEEYRNGALSLNDLLDRAELLQWASDDVLGILDREWSSADRETRTHILSAVTTSRTPSPAKVPIALKASAEPDERTRESAVHILRGFFDSSPEARGAVCAALADTASTVRKAAGYVLGVGNSPQKDAAVRAALRDPREVVRISALRAVRARNTGPRFTWSDIAASSASASVEERTAALSALSTVDVDSADAATPIFDALRDHPWEMESGLLDLTSARGRAADALRAALVEACADPECGVGAELVSRMSAGDDPTATAELLFAAFRSPRADVRLAAVILIARLEAYESFLVMGARDPEPEVRAETLNQIARISSPSDSLKAAAISILEDPDHIRLTAALRALNHARRRPDYLAERLRVLATSPDSSLADAARCAFAL